MKYFFSICLVGLFASSAFGQIGKWAPSAVRVGGDPGTLYYMIFSQKRGFFEFEADMDINRFFLVANYGISDYRLEKPTFLYTNTGTYWRLGADINFMHDDPNNNVMFFGFRYATNNFKDELNYDTQQVIHTETGWPNSTESMSNDNVSANWFEITTGMKIRVVKQLFLGFTLRYKLFMDTKGSSGLQPYYVPGFGKNVSASAFGFNYYISYRLPFRKKTIYLDKNKEVIAPNDNGLE